MKMVRLLLGFFIWITITPLTVAASEQTVYLDVPYTAQAASKAQSLDIYLPTPRRGAAQTDELKPVHIYVHGGAWTMGDKALPLHETQIYTQRGIILVSVNYRLGPEHKYPANIQDIRAATQWVKANISRYGGDPDAIVLTGHSAGAHLVALAGVTQECRSNSSSEPNYKAIFSIDTAAYDLTKPSEDQLARRVAKHKASVFGRTKRALRAASPLHQIKRRAQYCHIIIYVSAARPDAVLQSQRFEQKLSKANQPVWLGVMDESFTHRDMRKAIFDPRSDVWGSIMAELKR